jgi:hypothetical protein
MVTRKTPRRSHQLLVQSRHKIAMSGMAVAASSPITVTWGWRIGGASDCNETDHQNCGHTSGLRFQERGTYSDARKERDEFAAEFRDRFVWPVARSQSGAWKWTFCPECPRES